MEGQKLKICCLQVGLGIYSYNIWGHKNDMKHGNRM